MNFFVSTGSEDAKASKASCQGCGDFLFIHQAHHHQGSYWCTKCFKGGKHKSMGWGPVRFGN